MNAKQLIIAFCIPQPLILFGIQGGLTLWLIFHTLACSDTCISDYDFIKLILMSLMLIFYI